VNATPALIAELRERRPDLAFVVSTTTQTGFDRAQQLYAGNADVQIIRYPLDFTSAIERVLHAVRPIAVVLMELEVWPNFLRQCQKRGIPVVVANGRVTLPAMKRYAMGGWLVRGMFRKLAAAAVQDETYAERFAQLGVPTDRIMVLGTMKFDSATLAEKVPGDDALAAAVALRPGEEFIWVAGSTGPGEEEIVLKVYRALLSQKGRLRLVIVPRHPQRFDSVAQLIASHGFAVVRRSETRQQPAPLDIGPIPAVILGDTMGELRTFYSLADAVFVGRTMVDLGPRQHGSDMIEPAALAKPTIVGGFTGNFDMPMRRLRAASAVFEVPNAEQLRTTVAMLMTNPQSARDIGRLAQQVIAQSRGATAKHAELIRSILPTA
jgi:3-deoxy-D-manno-octulosonic-acid transferase